MSEPYPNTQTGPTGRCNSISCKDAARSRSVRKGTAEEALANRWWYAPFSKSSLDKTGSVAKLRSRVLATENLFVFNCLLLLWAGSNRIADTPFVRRRSRYQRVDPMSDTVAQEAISRTPILAPAITALKSAISARNGVFP